MNKKIIPFFIFLLLISSNIYAESCKAWQYAFFSFTTETTIKEKELKDIRTFALWNSPDAHIYWDNGEFLFGSVEKPLTEYFGIKKVHYLSVLNHLGSKGWEAYGFHANQISSSDKSRQWHFKKCIKE